MKYTVLIAISLLCITSLSGSCDLSIVGYIDSHDGIGSITSEFITCLKNDVSINFVPTRKKFARVPPDIQSLLKGTGPAHVSLLIDLLWLPTFAPFRSVPASPIKIAYSMFEATAVPPQWTAILNKYFDALVVPDPWLVDVYKNSGVTIPVFVLPLSLSQLPDYLKHKRQTYSGKRPFVFGNLSALEPRKNHETLIRAFAKAFGNSPMVKLHINSRFLNKDVLLKLNHVIREKNLTNVEVRISDLSETEYRELMSSFDCYITVSKGEGYSIPPRLAMAMGIPVILSDNSAHQTLCKTGFVTPVPTNVYERAYFFLFSNFIGSFSSCTVEAVSTAMKEVYTRYSLVCGKAVRGKEWVTTCTPDSLSPYYVNLVKPKQVVLGKNNIIHRDHLETNSSVLYQKYKQITQQL